MMDGCAVWRSGGEAQSVNFRSEMKESAGRNVEGRLRCCVHGAGSGPSGRPGRQPKRCCKGLKMAMRERTGGSRSDRALTRKAPDQGAALSTLAPLASMGAYAAPIPPRPLLFFIFFALAKHRSGRPTSCWKSLIFNSAGGRERTRGCRKGRKSPIFGAFDGRPGALPG